jgi:hypothetical protein
MELYEKVEISYVILHFGIKQIIADSGGQFHAPAALPQGVRRLGGHWTL